MAFSIFKKRPARLDDLSEADKREVFSTAERVVLSRMPGTKDRNFIETRLGVPITKLADFQSFLDVGCKKVWASFRACHLVANVLLSAQVRALRPKGRGGEPEQVKPDDPAAVLLGTPNPYDSWEELIYMWTFHMKLCGTAYWLKDQMNGAGQPAAVYPLLPQYVEIVPDAKVKVKRWRYRVNGTVLEFQPEQVVQFRRPHPNNLLTGLGDVEPSQEMLATHIGRDALEQKFLENGAQPSGIMSKKEAIEDETLWEALKEKWNKAYGGRKNAGKTAFMNGDWSYYRLGLTAQEMQLIERERWSIEQIFLIHGVPLSVAGLKDAANFATARQDDIRFRKYECVPLLDVLVGRLNMAGGLAQSYGEGTKYDYDLAGLIDVEQTCRDYGPLVELGAMTPNQLRVMAGLPKADDPYLDQYFIRSTLVPLALSGISPPQQEPAAGTGM